MTTNTYTHLRPATLAQLAAELVIDHADDLADNDDYAFNFRTEAAKNAYVDIQEALVDAIGEPAAFDLLDQAIAREWDAYNDKMFS